MSVDKAVERLLNGGNISEELDALLAERVVCRYTGSPKKMRRRGRLVYYRSRTCTGVANQQRSQKASRAWISGSSKQKQSRSQIRRWQNFKPKAMRSRQLPGRRR